jgi:hypothetical protein
MDYSDLFTNFYLSYGKEEGMKSANKGARSVCYESWKKSIKRHGIDEAEFAKQVRNGYISYMKNRQATRAAGQFVPNLKMLSTFLNQDAWEAGLDEDTGELLLKAISMTCSEKDCNNDALYCGDEIKLCQKHYLDLSVYPEQRDIYKEMVEIYGGPDSESFKSWAIKTIKKIGSFEKSEIETGGVT